MKRLAGSCSWFDVNRTTPFSSGCLIYISKNGWCSTIATLLGFILCFFLPVHKIHYVAAIFVFLQTFANCVKWIQGKRFAKQLKMKKTRYILASIEYLILWSRSGQSFASTVSTLQETLVTIGFTLASWSHTLPSAVMSRKTCANRLHCRPTHSAIPFIWMFVACECQTLQHVHFSNKKNQNLMLKHTCFADKQTTHDTYRSCLLNISHSNHGTLPTTNPVELASKS